MFLRCQHKGTVNRLTMPCQKQLGGSGKFLRLFHLTNMKIKEKIQITMWWHVYTLYKWTNNVQENTNRLRSMSRSTNWTKVMARTLSRTLFVLFRLPGSFQKCFILSPFLKLFENRRGHPFRQFVLPVLTLLRCQIDVVLQTLSTSTVEPLSNRII